MATSTITLYFCILSIVFMCQVLSTHQQNAPIVMAPVDTKASLGTDAVFYCQVRAGTKDLIYWVVNRQIGLGPHKNRNAAYPRYEIFGDSIRGYYNLRIKNVTASDAVRYDCVVEPNSGTTFNYEAGAVLTVVTDVVEPTPESPICISTQPSPTMMYEEGDELPNYRCRATGGTPVGELRWNVLRSDRSIVDVAYDIQVDGTSITATSSAITLTAADHNSQLVCSLRHPSLDVDLTCAYPETEKILVRHVPQVEFGPAIEITYLESTSVKISCMVSAYPEVATLDPVLTFSDPEMVYNITRKEPGSLIEAVVEVSHSVSSSDVGKLINCTAGNALGQTTVTIQVKLNRLLPSWLLITVLLICVVILLAITVCCCVCICKPDRKAEDQPDVDNRKSLRAAGYDVTNSKTNGIGGEDGHSHMMDDDSFADIPLNDYSSFPSSPAPPSSGDIETGEVNDGYMTPTSDERFPPMIEDEHMMGEKPVSTFKSSFTNGDAMSTPPPPPPLDLQPPEPIPYVDAE